MGPGIKRGLLPLAGLAAGLLAAEAGLRLLARLPPPTLLLDHRELWCEYDPTLGWRKTPLKSGWSRTWEYAVQERTNARGLRGPEACDAKPHGEYRVLVLGDSFAEGWGVGFEQTFIEAAKRRLNGPLPPRPRYEFINAGVEGYSTDQELLWFKAEGPRYHPGLVVLAFYYNDVFWNGQPAFYGTPKPLFALEGNRLRLTNVPVPRGPARNPGRSCVWNLVRALSLIQRVDPRARAREERLVYRDDWEAIPAIRRSWAITDALLGELKRSVESSGARLLVFYVPAREEAQAGWWPAPWRRDGVERTVRRLCAQRGISFLSPAEELRRAARDKPAEPLYYRLDPHWTPRGHDAAGKVLAAWIAARFRTARR